jgi:hypothetical protein
VSVTFSAASARHSCGLVPSAVQTVPLCVTSRCQTEGEGGISPARIALKRPRREASAILAAPPAAIGKVPGPRMVRVAWPPSTVSTSPGRSVTWALSGKL